MGAQEIVPYRLNQLMKAASKVTDQMVNGTWSLTYDEMDIILDLIRCGIRSSREANMAGSGSGRARKGE